MEKTNCTICGKPTEDSLLEVGEHENVCWECATKMALEAKAENREIVKETAVNGIDASQFPRIEAAGFSGTVYLGVIANTPRLQEVAQYLEYLMK